MKVKQLQFVQSSGINDKYKKYKIIWIAPIGGFTCSGGNAYYQVLRSQYDPPDAWNCTFFIGCIGEQIPRGACSSLEEGMKICQEDFERKILANIDKEEDNEVS